MIEELGKESYYKLNDLIKSNKFPEVGSVVLRNNPGWVFVDDTDNPKSALIFAKGMGGLYLLGDHTNVQFKNELISFIESVVYARLTSLDISWIEISGMSEEWNGIIEEIFHDKDLGKDKQLVYKLKKHRSVNEENIDNVMQVDENTFDLEISNLDFLRDEIQQFWGRIENFLSKGICRCYLLEKEIVSSCYSGLVKDNIHTIGIETLENHRRRGYGFEIAKAFIDECKMKSVEPHWDCSNDNEGSIFMAEKLGLEIEYEYTCYWYRVSKVEDNDLS